MLILHRLAFEKALEEGQMSVARNGVRLTATELDSLKVSDLEQGLAITLLQDPIKLSKRNYCLNFEIGLLRDYEKEAIEKHPLGVEYCWRGVKVSPPIMPREPCFPESRALDFLKEIYQGTLGALTDDGKIMLD